jgi:hypothetical protein
MTLIFEFVKIALGDVHKGRLQFLGGRGYPIADVCRLEGGRGLRNEDVCNNKKKKQGKSLSKTQNFYHLSF